MYKKKKLFLPLFKLCTLCMLLIQIRYIFSVYADYHNNVAVYDRQKKKTAKYV